MVENPNEPKAAAEKEPKAAAEPKPKVAAEPEPKTTVSLNLEIPVEANERLKALAEFWRMSRKQTAQKLITEAIKHRAGMRGL